MLVASVLEPTVLERGQHDPSSPRTLTRVVQEVGLSGKIGNRGCEVGCRHWGSRRASWGAGALIHHFHRTTCEWPLQRAVPFPWGAHAGGDVRARWTEGICSVIPSAIPKCSRQQGPVNYGNVCFTETSSFSLLRLSL